MNSTVRETYFDDEGKQLRRLPEKWMTPHSLLKVGGKVRLINHIALRLGTRGPEHANWDGVVEILEVHSGRGQFPSRDISDADDDGPVWDTQTNGYLVVTLPYPYSVDTVTGTGTFKTICHLSDEGNEWELVLPSFKGRGVSGRIRV